MKEIKLGIIGLSPGNGHPYSWSAIFNGYDSEKIKLCPFPVIPDYLSKQKFPQDSIAGAKVTHIWTQDPQISKQVAGASKIPHIVSNISDLIGQVDGILLARDDAENHFNMAEAFIKAGLPIFIDKPLAYTVNEAKKIMALETYPGQIFTCSSLRYSQDLLLTPAQKEKIGQIKHVIGHTPKDWKKYSIHIIEPALTNLGRVGSIENFQSENIDGKTTLSVQWESGLQGTFMNFENSPTPIQLQFIGTHGSETLIFKNTFQTFKASLENFIISVQEKKRLIPIEQTFASIDLIEKGGG